MESLKAHYPTYAETMLSGATNPQSPYPDDVRYNIASMNGRVYCKNPDRAIVDYIAAQHLQKIIVKQGYAQCGAIVLNAYAAITEDLNLTEVMTRHGVEVLCIRKGYVRLEGHEYGFIGGCAGRYARMIIFNGCVEAPPDFTAIRAFLLKHGYRWLSLTAMPLEDCGGIFYFTEKAALV
jgi:hypothetical protein